jgi:hypothetical protein
MPCHDIFVAPILVLAVLIVLASCVRRSKAESVALGLVAAALPLLARNRAEGKITSITSVPDAALHFAAGSCLVWRGSAVLITSALFAKTESAQRSALGSNVEVRSQAAVELNPSATA